MIIDDDDESSSIMIIRDHLGSKQVLLLHRGRDIIKAIYIYNMYRPYRLYISIHRPYIYITK